MTSTARRILEIGSLAVRAVPLSMLGAVGEAGGKLAASRLDQKRKVLVANLKRVRPELTDPELESMARRGFASYGRYWAETLRLPTLSADVIDRGFDVGGYQHIQRSLAAGFGPIMVLPHLGGWEWAAAWLGRVAQLPVSAVVEQLEPEDVFDWFSQLRESYGVNVIPLGPDAMGDVVVAVKEGHVVCLLADRNIDGSGFEVEFFGATTKLPIGPALLSRRTGAPMLMTAVYFRGKKRFCQVGPPLWPVRTSDFRGDLTRMTQTMAIELERLIDQAPDQWHVLEPIWDL